MAFPRGLVAREARQGSALLALYRLDAVMAACARLERGEGEALHDFRVALRRLRVVLRVYRDVLGGKAVRKAGRRARRVARATASARDAEVSRRWLESWERRLRSEHQGGIEALRRHMADRSPAEAARAVDEARADFLALEAELRPALTDRAARGGEGKAFGPVSARLVGRTARRLRRALDTVEAADQDVRVHRARIAGKRLRYLLEPFASRSADCRRALGALRHLQETLGSVHDLNLFIDAVARCARKEVGAWSTKLVRTAAGKGVQGDEAAGRDERDPAPGLVRLASLAGRQRSLLFGRYKVKWEAEEAGRVFHGVEALLRALAEPAVAPAPDGAAAVGEGQPRPDPVQEAPRGGLGPAVVGDLEDRGPEVPAGGEERPNARPLEVPGEERPGATPVQQGDGEAVVVGRAGRPRRARGGQGPERAEAGTGAAHRQDGDPARA
ncbi:MAG: CHAD domain-containing protein [Planctomycetes bacterium]|nr:CHAD domain-containing protein [Planctomycetota bacterium]